MNAQDPILIREAGDHDIAAVLDLYTTLDSAPATDPGVPRLDPDPILAAMRKYPWHRLFVATLDGRIIGTFTLTIIDYLAHHGAKAGLMEAVVVSPVCRSQGIGKAMVAYALDCCRDQGCYKLALSSNVTRQRAHAFYEREGFTLHGYSLAVPL